MIWRTSRPAITTCTNPNRNEYFTIHWLDGAWLRNASGHLACSGGRRAADIRRSEVCGRCAVALGSLYAEQFNCSQSSRVIIIIKTLPIGYYKCGCDFHLREAGQKKSGRRNTSAKRDRQEFLLRASPLRAPPAPLRCERMVLHKFIII